MGHLNAGGGMLFCPSSGGAGDVTVNIDLQSVVDAIEAIDFTCEVDVQSIVNAVNDNGVKLDTVINLLVDQNAYLNTIIDLLTQANSTKPIQVCLDGLYEVEEGNCVEVIVWIYDDETWNVQHKDTGLTIDPLDISKVKCCGCSDEWEIISVDTICIEEEPETDDSSIDTSVNDSDLSNVEVQLSNAVDCKGAAVEIKTVKSIVPIWAVDACREYALDGTELSRTEIGQRHKLVDVCIENVGQLSFDWSSSFVTNPIDQSLIESYFLGTSVGAFSFEKERIHEVLVGEVRAFNPLRFDPIGSNTDYLGALGVTRTTDNTGTAWEEVFKDGVEYVITGTTFEYPQDAECENTISNPDTNEQYVRKGIKRLKLFSVGVGVGSQILAKGEYAGPQSPKISSWGDSDGVAGTVVTTIGSYYHQAIDPVQGDIKFDGQNWQPWDGSYMLLINPPSVRLTKSRMTSNNGMYADNTKYSEPLHPVQNGNGYIERSTRIEATYLFNDILSVRVSWLHALFGDSTFEKIQGDYIITDQSTGVERLSETGNTDLANQNASPNFIDRIVLGFYPAKIQANEKFTFNHSIEMTNQNQGNIDGVGEIWICETF